MLCECIFGVAPLAGSVDRNIVICVVPCIERLSLPSRGAWIEIAIMLPSRMMLRVAPLAGSVDRNFGNKNTTTSQTGSLPSRGAWIEIRCVTG